MLLRPLKFVNITLKILIYPVLQLKSEERNFVAMSFFFLLGKLNFTHIGAANDIVGLFETQWCSMGMQPVPEVVVLQCDVVVVGVSKNDQLFAMKAEVLARLPLTT